MCLQSFLFFPPLAAHRALIEQDPEPRQTGIVDAKTLLNAQPKKTCVALGFLSDLGEENSSGGIWEM